MGTVAGSVGFGLQRVKGHGGKTVETVTSRIPAAIAPCRNKIETSFQNGDQCLGLGDYKGRSWVGWHQHTILSLLAHFFLVRQRLRLKKASALAVRQVADILKAVLFRPRPELPWLLDLVAYRALGNGAATRSHIRRRRGDLP